MCARYSDNYYAVAKVRQFIFIVTRILGDARECAWKRHPGDVGSSNVSMYQKISRIKDFDDQNAHTDQKERKKEVKIKREPRLKKGEHLPRV